MHYFVQKTLPQKNPLKLKVNFINPVQASEINDIFSINILENIDNCTKKRQNTMQHDPLDTDQWFLVR